MFASTVVACQSSSLPLGTIGWTVTTRRWHVVVAYGFPIVGVRCRPLADVGMGGNLLSHDIASREKSCNDVLVAEERSCEEEAARDPNGRL